MNLYMEDIMDEMKFRRTHLRGRGGGVRLKGQGDPSLEAVTDPDPMGQWAWLSKVMETAEKKRQNVMEFQPFLSYTASIVVKRGFIGWDGSQASVVETSWETFVVLDLFHPHY